jgi:PucR family transcriptional regulator, purine catabolism regulatory protein
MRRSSVGDAALLAARANAFERLATAAADEEAWLERVLRILASAAAGSAALLDAHGALVASAPSRARWTRDAASHAEANARADVTADDVRVATLDVRGSDRDPEVAEFAAMLIGGTLVRRSAILADRRRLAEQALQDVLRSVLDADVVVRRLAAFGVSFDGPNQVLVGHANDASTEPSARSPEDLRALLRDVRAPGLRGTLGDEIVLVDAAEAAADAAASLYADLSRDGAPATVGIGGAYRDPIGLRISYAEARAAAQKGPGVHPSEPLFLAGFIRLEPPEEVVADLAARALAPLVAHDDRRDARARQDGVGLVRTLETFLSSDCSTARAAQRLNVHPNTVRYRLRQIEASTGHDLSSFQTRAHFWFALAAMGHRRQGTHA